MFVTFAVEMATMGIGNPFLQNPFLQNLTSLLHQTVPQWGTAPPLSNKAVASMWMNHDAKQQMQVQQQQQQQQEEEEVDDEEMGVAETYADYMPSKCM